MQTVTSADYDRDVEIMVSREIRYCLSHLVHELAQDEKHLDDLAPVLVRDDYEEAAYDYARNAMSRQRLSDYVEHDLGTAVYDDESHEELAQVVSTGQAEAEEFCNDFGLDPIQDEAFEHWAVTDWLADKLEAKGEMIARDFLGLTIWGRTTTGQAISMDRVIREIYDDIHRKAA